MYSSVFYQTWEKKLGMRSFQENWDIMEIIKWDQGKKKGTR